MTDASGSILTFVGTYTHLGSEGIYVYRMSAASGELTFASVIGGISDPSYLAIHPGRRHLYAVNEADEVDGEPGGALSAYSIDAGTGGLTFLNRQSTKGAGPCHVSVDASGRFALVANYMGGSVAVLPIDAQGRLGEATEFVQHHGSSVNPDRQGEPHAHSITLDPTNRYAFVADLGLDKVMAYRFDATRGKLTSADEPSTPTAPGAGPRHFDFHPGGRYAFLINEIGNTLTSFAYDADRGALREVQTLSTLPEGFSGTTHCADVHVSPDGRFVYGSNRGHDSIAIFEIDQSTGEMTFVDHQSTQGRNPRNFVIDPSGAFLLAANQDSGNIVTFRVDQATGRLSPTGHVAEVPGPVCLKLTPMRD